MQSRIKVVLYTREGCGLCEEMKAEMTQAGCDELYRLEEVDNEVRIGAIGNYEPKRVGESGRHIELSHFGDERV